MPMDPKYEELEKDIIEKYGGGRVWQEMAKNPPNEKTLSTFGYGKTPRLLIEHRKRKTKKGVGAEVTKVTRTEIE